MEEAEVPLEESQEHIQHHAEHAAEGKRWILGVALSSAIFAALAAVASLQAGHHANEAMMAQIDANNQILKASDQWTYYQAKGIKAAILSAKLGMEQSVDKPRLPEDEANVKRYADEQKEITEKAKGFEERADTLKEEGRVHLEHHEKLATSVTMFQICIAISAISVLTQRRAFWWVSLLAGAAGVFFMVSGLFVH